MKKLALLILLLCICLASCQADFPVMTQSEETATWTMVLALVAPLVYSALQQSGFGEKLNALIALGLCLAVSIADAYIFGGGWAGITPGNVSGIVYNVLTAAFVSYEMIWSPLGLSGWIESKTDWKRAG